jgi:hypothetical protein
MFKRILTVLMCFVLVLGVSSLAFAKKAKVKKAVVSEESSVDEERPTTVVKKMSEPKDSLKEKIGLAFSPLGAASVRMWLTNSMGLDMLANIHFESGVQFGIGVGANLVFPMLEEGPVAVFITPGMNLNFTSFDGGGSRIGFGFMAGLEAEAFIVRNVISIGGTFGLGIGLDVTSPPAPLTSTTTFTFDVGTSPAMLFVRVYL